MWSDVRPETGNTGPDGINGELGGKFRQKTNCEQFLANDVFV